MLIRIDKYEKCYPKRLKKIFQSHLNMNTYSQFIPNMQNAVVGNIPPELIRLFPKRTRAKNIKDFQAVLADMTTYLRQCWREKQISQTLLNPETFGKSDLIISWEKEANGILNDYLQKFSDTPLKGKLEYIDFGVCAELFKLSIFDKDGNKIIHDKALKVFFSPYGNPALFKTSLHGNFAEANCWTYLKHAVGHPLDKTQFTKHYISDLHSGYSLTEFADEKIHKTTAPIDFKTLFKISYTDTQRNPKIYKKIYDVGGFKKLQDFIDDKIVLRYFKKLLFRSEKELPCVIKNIETQAKNPKNEHRHKIQKALDLFKQL